MQAKSEYTHNSDSLQILLHIHCCAFELQKEGGGTSKKQKIEEPRFSKTLAETCEEKKLDCHNLHHPLAFETFCTCVNL